MPTHPEIPDTRKIPRAPDMKKVLIGESKKIRKTRTGLPRTIRTP